MLCPHHAYYYIESLAHKNTVQYSQDKSSNQERNTR